MICTDTELSCGGRRALAYIMEVSLRERFLFIWKNTGARVGI